MSWGMEGGVAVSDGDAARTAINEKAIRAWVVVLK